jgi:hypothetical protein
MTNSIVRKMSKKVHKRNFWLKKLILNESNKLEISTLFERPNLTRVNSQRLKFRKFWSLKFSLHPA